MPKIFWIGLVLLVGGTGPLCAIILLAETGLLADPNPNPVGPGLLAGITIWPSLGLMAAGTVMRILRR